VRTLEDLLAELPGADVLVVSQLWSNELVVHARRLRFIQSISAGVDQYDQELLRERGIRLASAAGVTTQAVAEHAMALILALQRHLHTARDNQARKHWRAMIAHIPSREDELGGKTLLIVGLGRLAAAGLDVMREEPLPASSPLWSMPNVLITPHKAGETQRVEDAVIDLLLDNLGRLWRGETALTNQVV
jgi:phosphoglycerate dehydrogenase-like enzyme